MKRCLVVIFLSSLALAQQPAPSTPEAAAGQSSSPGPAGPVSAVNVRELLPELPPLPEGKATRIGGTITRFDSVQDHLTVQAFGGDEIKVLLDGRTRVYRGTAAGSIRDLRNGERVALDTVLDGTQIFARNIHILQPSPTGESHGQVVSYDYGRNVLIVRDPLAPGTVKLRLASYTVVLRDGHAIPRQELSPGTLVTVEFVADGHGNAFAHQILVQATPGRNFVFPGKVTYLNLRTGLLVVTDPRSQTSYEIHFNPEVLPIPSNLQEGTDVTVTATFEGRRYVARAVTVNPAPVQ